MTCKTKILFGMQDKVQDLSAHIAKQFKANTFHARYFANRIDQKLIAKGAKLNLMPEGTRR